MRVLVTGAGGFVGRALLPLLLSRGHLPRAAVRQPLSASAAVESRIVGDIGPATCWDEALTGMEAVVHLAARVHVMHEQHADPLAAFRAVNVAGTERLARAAALAGVRRLVYLSSVKVNGEFTLERPFNETDPAAPEDAYGLSKWEAEQALALVARETGLEVVILRPPLVYGPGVGANFLRLMRLAGRGFPLPLAAVHNRRSLIYLGNLCSTIVACLEHPSAANRTYLVSDGQDVSTPELVRALARHLGVPARVWPLPVGILKLLARATGKSAEIDRLIGSLMLDNSRLYRELDWKPPYTLDQGLEQTAAWFRNLNG